ncbi:MAG: AAA family ATPase [Bacteroidales bacterium]
MNKLPIGQQDFKGLIDDNCIYVDKTETIYKMITEGKYYFLSRPRRFGKSLLVSTIKEIFSGNKYLFKDLWIENKWDWNQKFPIIHLPFASIGYEKLSLETAISTRILEIANRKENNITIEASTIDQQFRELVLKLQKKFNQPVIILVDEYDKPIIDYIGTDLQQAKANQKTLKTFYSVIKDLDASIRFCFLTGVSKFSKVSVFSDLNNLRDITISKAYSDILGITQTELEFYFKDYIVSLGQELSLDKEEILEKIKLWYNGYNWTGKDKVYNPFSTLLLFRELDFKNYWFASATPTFLIDLLRDQQIYDINNSRVGQVVFESFEISDKINIRSLLFQTGYLTIKGVDKRGIYTLGYPNKEVREAFLDYLIEGFSGSNKEEVKPLIFDIEDAFIANNIEEVIRLTNRLFKNLPYQLHDRTEKFYHAVIHLMYYYLGIYIDSEVCTSDGRADAVVQTDTHIYCLEFKLNQSAKIALQQIEDRGYLQKYSGQGKKLVAVGINVSSKVKGIDDWDVVDWGS